MAIHVAAKQLQLLPCQHSLHNWQRYVCIEPHMAYTRHVQHIIVQVGCARATRAAHAMAMSMM
jgi:hypothetical protein